MKLTTLLLAGSILATSFTPATAQSSRFHERNAYEEVCSDGPALAVVYDVTSERREDEKRVAAKVVFHVENFTEAGRGVAFYTDYGNGAPTRQAAMCKPTPCNDAHPLWKVFNRDDRVCTEEGYQTAQKLFSNFGRLAVQPFLGGSSSPNSDVFGALAAVADDLRSAGYTSGEIIMVSDGLQNAPDAVYSPSVPWLTDDNAKASLLASLRVRGALPNLTGFTVHFVLGGRPLATEALERGEWLTADQNAEIRAFWEWFAETAGADGLTWEGDFLPEVIPSLQMPGLAEFQAAWGQE